VNTEPQKPMKSDYIQLLWLALAGGAVGFILNMMTDKGINIMKALGL
jgi:hypothetical protein